MSSVSTNHNRVFITSGAVAGASYYSIFGNVGITMMGTGFGMGIGPITVGGAIAGAALQGGVRALDGDLGAIGMGLVGTLGGATLYQSIGGIGLVGSFGALGLGLGSMIASGGILGLGLYSLLAGSGKSQARESPQAVFVRMENQIVEREAYAQALLELVMLSPEWQEREWQQKFRHLEADHELDMMKQQMQPQAKTAFSIPKNYASAHYWANASETFHQRVQAHPSWSYALKIPETAVVPPSTLAWQNLQRFQAHSEAIRAISLHPDGQTLLTASDDQTVSTWDLQTGRCQFTFCGTGAAVLAVEFSPDGSTLASGGADHKVSRWDWKTRRLQKTFHYLTQPYSHKGWVHDLCYLSTGQALASSGGDGTIRLWSTRTGTLIRTLTGHSDTVFAIATTADDRLLVSGGADKTLRIWDVISGEQIRVIPAEQGWVNSVAISTNGRLIASGGFDQSVKLWDLESGNCITLLRGHSSPVLAVAFSPDNKTLVSGSHHDGIHVWGITATANGQVSVTLDQTLSLRGECFKFSRDGTTLVSGDAQGVVGVWQLRPHQTSHVSRLSASTPWWEILGVDPTANRKVVKNVYIDLAKQFHPDLNPSSHAKISMQRINSAYQEFLNSIETAGC